VLFVPFYTLVFPLLGHHLEPVQAVQIGILTEIFGFASSTSAFWRRRLIDFRVAGFALLFAVPTAVLGGYLANRVPGGWLLVAVGLGLMVFSFLLLRETVEHVRAVAGVEGGGYRGGASGSREHRDRFGRIYRYVPRNDAVRAGSATLGGLLQGLVGFSAGETSTVEQVLRGVPVRLAAGNAHLIIAGASLSAATTHLLVVASEGATIPWNILAASVPAVLVGGQVAGFLAGRIPQRTLRKVLAGFLGLIGVLSFYRASVTEQLALPGWALLAVLMLFLALLGLYLLRGLGPRCKLCHMSHRIYGTPTGRPGNSGGCC
jgi:uncharacterized membrane protein YfcA